MKPSRHRQNLNPSPFNRKFCLEAVLWVSLVFAGVHNASAVAFRLPNQDPEGIARGNAFAATADNPSAIYYNPAGITQLEGQTISAGMYLVSAHTEYTSPTGAKAQTDDKFQPVPQLYYVYSPTNSPLSFGLGVYAPYGLSLDWGTPPFKTLAENGKLLYATINPIVAWKIHRTLSVGIGPTINYSEAELNRAMGIISGDQFRFKGHGVDYGFNAGLLWQPHEQWSLGVNYRSATKINYRGESEANPIFAPRGTSASIPFPQFVVGGISFRPTEKWNVEFDVDWTDWNSVNTVQFKNTSFGTVPFVLNYQSSFMYEFGVTRKFANGYFASIGYFYSENSSPDANFNPIVPDGDLHLGSFGVGHKGKRWDLTVAYHFATNGDGRVVRGSTPAGLADGTYKTFNQAVNFSAVFKF
jgi:long-chain fatty acid transport protein